MASLVKYRCNTGQYKGMWHVRLYANGKYKHIGRYATKREAEAAIREKLQEPEGLMSWKSRSEDALRKIAAAYR